MRTISKLIIHCSATPEGRDVKVDEIRRWHLQRGFSDIGYHYVIHLDGKIEAGRQLELAGAHCTGHNAHSIGVCYVGGCNKNMQPKDTRTVAQKAALVKLIKGLKDRYPGATVHGHNEFAQKACPSFDVQKWRKEVGL